MRILELSLLHAHEFARILQDAATPPPDRTDVERALRTLNDAYDPRAALAQVAEHPQLLEFVVRGATSGHRYGVLLVDLGHVADTVAYWREPPLFRDESYPLPHGASRAHALALATDRVERLR